MQRRKKDVGKYMAYLREREKNGIPLPPTMRRGSKEYVKSSYWTTLNQRCVNGAHFNDTPKNSAYKKKKLLLEITKQEFIDWVDAVWSKFESLYSSGKTPSIDRIDNSIGYRISNMQVIDLKINMAKDRIKPVIATSIFTGEVKRYPSAKAAAIDGFEPKNISRAIKTGMNHKGFRWRFEV